MAPCGIRQGYKHKEVKRNNKHGVVNWDDNHGKSARLWQYENQRGKWT